jgi:hypothetical protein
MDRIFRIANFRFTWKLIFFLSIVSITVDFSLAQNSPCKFDPNSLQFSGTPREQARCLLRPVKPRGVLGARLERLPKPLDKLIGEKVKIKKESLKKFLLANKISESEIGGPLDEPLAAAKLPGGEAARALYFVIHDTSTPNYRLESFPADFNEKSWRFNNLEMWLKNPVAHVFVNRLGESITTTAFAKPVKKGWGTKFARDFLKTDGKALQLHVELVQPRRSDADWFEGNDAVAPEIGFTDRQYERLALLYVAASARRGSWLIPAFHCAVDAGIKDAHDDPQNFELAKFNGKIAELTRKIK